VVLAILGLVGNAVTVLWLGGLAAGTPDSPDLVAVGAGALLLSIAGAVPVLGNLLVSLVTAVGLGAVGRHLYRTRNDRRSSGATPRNRRSSPPRR